MSDERKHFSGSDLASAIAAARAHFNASRREIEFEVVRQGKIGPVETPNVTEIIAWRREGPLPPAPDHDAPRERGFGGHGRGRGPRGDRDGRGGRGGDRGPRHGDRGSRHSGPRHDDRGSRSFAPRGEGHDRTHDVGAGGVAALVDLLPGPEVTEPQEVLQQLARGLVGGLGLDLEITGVEETPAGLRVKLEGGDVPLLLEAEAEGLESMQYLANRILQKDGRLPNRVSFDAGGHRAQAEARLVAEAKRVAEQVRGSGQTHKMPALGPYERRLVHMALADEPGIKTYSTGSGYHRRLHVAPLDAEEPSGVTDPA